MGQQGISFEVGLPLTPELEQDPVKAAELQRIINGIYNVAAMLDYYTGNAPVSVATSKKFTVASSIRSSTLDVLHGYAQEDIPAGAAVYTRKVGDDLHVFKATASSAGTFATGFLVTDGGVTSGSFCAVNIGGGLIPYIAGLSEGVVYYLSDTPGFITNVGGSAISQKLGYAVGPTSFYFIPNPP
jgi:hypothetical protein